MSITHIPYALRQQIAERDRYRCSYCRTAEIIAGDEFVIDHILPEALGGLTEVNNLCLSCWRCNLIKGKRIVGLDPLSNKRERLYHPVNQWWHDHLVWIEGGLLIQGITPTGRATVYTIQLNRPNLVGSRKLWIAAGWHPPRE
jgi:hypothetical protein